MTSIKSNRGGARPNSGPKKKEPKEPVTIRIETTIIDVLGGREVCANIARNEIYRLNKQKSRNRFKRFKQSAV